MTHPEATKTHFYGLDLLRLVFVFAIVYFHTLETFFYDDTYVLPHGDSFFSYLQPLIRALTFSGFALVTLSSFLLGWINMTGRKWRALVVILTIGAVLLALLQADTGEWWAWDWDIYHFLFISFTFIAVLQTHTVFLYAATIVFFPLLFFRVWEWPIPLASGSLWTDLLIGDCSGGGGGWPLIPWLAIPFSMYTLARWIQLHPKVKHAFHSPPRWEWLIWITALIALSPWLGGYFYTPIGGGFACYVHRRPPVEFWSQWIVVLFFIRLSFVHAVNNALKSIRFVRALATLHWSKHLGLAYALHFVFLQLGYAWREDYLRVPYLIDVFFLMLLFGVEALNRMIVFLFGSSFFKKQRHS